MNEMDELTGLYPMSNGGSENMYRLMTSMFDEVQLYDYQIICSRVRKLLPDKKRIIWLHDMVNDPENEWMNEPSNHNAFHAFVFVSHTQKEEYLTKYNLPIDRCFVIKNCTDIVRHKPKRDNKKINLIYHTTPHRGLHILVPVFQQLAKEHPNKLHLDVFSSFEAYGWKDRDEPFQELFDVCKNHSDITYHGYQDKSIVHECLLKSDIFAYPSVWKETSCIAMMEALVAGCYPVYTSLGALPETTVGYGTQIQPSDDHNYIANELYTALKNIIDNHAVFKAENNFKTYYNTFSYEYSVGRFKSDWKKLFNYMERAYVKKS